MKIFLKKVTHKFAFNILAIYFCHIENQKTKKFILP